MDNQQKKGFSVSLGLLMNLPVLLVPTIAGGTWVVDHYTSLQKEVKELKEEVENQLD